MTPTEAHEWIWQHGWPIFVDNYGWSETKSRTIVGNWIKRHGPQLTQRALSGIYRERPIEPIAWASAGFRKIHEKAAKLNKGGRIPRADLPPQVPMAERVDPGRFVKLKEMLEDENGPSTP